MKNDILFYLITFIILFLTLFIFSFIFKIDKQKSYIYITKKYKLEINNKKKNILRILLCLINSFIIIFTLFIYLIFNSKVYMLIVVALIDIVFIYLFYNLLGLLFRKGK